ncbi:response regulator [Paraburkholderia sp. CI3]|uniref:response regulator n=1 Tax=Paraburkholderia sp. CI3 TaxID=2991060 RepID=UPI003D1D52AA
MSASTAITVLLADDHRVVRAGIAALLESTGRFHVIAQADDGIQAVAQFRIHRPRIVLTDLRMPHYGGVQVIQQIRRIDPQSRIVILTTFDGEEDIYRGLNAGARAYLLKEASLETLLDCLETVARGECYAPPDQVAAKLASRVEQPRLTLRELDILQRVALGHSNKQIAARAAICEATVKKHVSSAFDKLKASSRTQAVLIARTRGLILG